MKIANYLIKEKLSQGNNFTVYRAVKETDSTPYVLKVLDKRAVRTINIINAARHEYDLLKQLDSQYVIKAISQIDNKDYVILELEDINAQPLKDIIKKQIPPEQFTELAVMISSGLADIHRQNIIHKDINPTNIIWNSQTGALKIIDFDIASKFDLKISHLGNPEKLQGTLPYISPEQTGRMNRTVDYRTDFYSLGVTFYEMLTGQLPFQNSNPMEIVYAHLARNPQDPHSINKQIPEQLSQIVLKLLSKNPEERYQSAQGLKNDLEKYREMNRSDSPLPVVFKLGENDFSGKLQIPEKLYGRTKEIEQLLSAFQRVCKGSKEMVLVAGYSGTGKTSLVNEMHKSITKEKGYFVTGKFDQLQRTVPYFAFIQAFNQFCELLLTEKQEVLAQRKERILLAVGNLGKMLTDMIPQLETVIGKQPDVPEVSGDEASKRFNYVFHSLFQAIATEKYPLVMFIDDLQWADLVSLDLLKLVTQDRQNPYLLLIGASRDNEVSHTHPLTTAIEEISKLDMAVHTIPVKNLSHPNVLELLRDTLKTSSAKALRDVASLTDLIYQKTQGNAFFTIQFIENLYRENLLCFDFIQSVWIYDIAQIEKQNITDNVADLLVRKIQTLSTEVQDVLKLASCIGNIFDLNTLSVISEKGLDEHARNLETALTEHLIYPLEQKDYKFVHDRIHQAAYSLIADEHKKPLHLKIGRLLLKGSDVSITSKVPKEIEQNIFELVNHLNIGIELIEDEKEKIQLAHLNLKAGQNAKISAAYKIGAEYVQTAIRLLPDDCWKLHYDLTLAIYNEALQTSYLCGNIEEMENFIEKVLTFSSDISHTSVAYKHRIITFVMVQNQPHRAVETLLNIFSGFGINIPKEPTKVETEKIFLKIRKMLDQKELASLKNLPMMRDPQKQLVMQLFDMGALAFITAGGGAYPFVLRQMVDLVLQNGLTPETPHVLSLFGILKVLLGDISGAYNLGKVAMELSNEKFGNEAAKYRSVVIVCIYMLGQKQHYKKVCKLFMENYQHALNAGDFEFASSVLNNYIWCLSRTDTELAIINEKARSMRNTTLQLKQSLAADVFEIEVAATDSLLGLNSDPAILDIDLDSLFPNAPEQITKFLTCSGHIKQIILAYFFNDYDNILSYIKAAEEKWIAGSMPITYLQSDLYFYIPLACFQLYTKTETTDDDKETYLKKAKENIKNMKKWADLGPINFLHKYYLLQAELCRVTGKSEQAADYFDKAIETAYENDYVNDAALANELAGKFYMKKNKAKFAALYFIEARNCYQKWGATAKVRHLETHYPKYLNMYAPASTTGTVTASSTGSISEGLDVASILKASQTLSGEVRLKNLLEKMWKMPNCMKTWKTKSNSAPVNCKKPMPRLKRAVKLPSMPIRPKAIFWPI